MWFHLRKRVPIGPKKAREFSLLSKWPILWNGLMSFIMDSLLFPSSLSHFSPFDCKTAELYRMLARKSLNMYNIRLISDKNRLCLPRFSLGSSKSDRLLALKRSTYRSRREYIIFTAHHIFERLWPAYAIELLDKKPCRINTIS